MIVAARADCIGRTTRSHTSLVARLAGGVTDPQNGFLQAPPSWDHPHMTVSEPPAALPFNDPSRRSRLVKVVLWLVGLAIALVLLNLLGVDVVGWIQDLWDQIKEVPAGYIVAALVFQSGQTVLAGVSYYGILKAAYGDEVTLAPIVTAYAVGVAMNNFLPANIGTLVTLLMFVALIPSCTFAAP